MTHKCTRYNNYLCLKFSWHVNKGDIAPPLPHPSEMDGGEYSPLLVVPNPVSGEEGACVAIAYVTGGRVASPTDGGSGLGVRPGWGSSGEW